MRRRSMEEEPIAQSGIDDNVSLSASDVCLAHILAEVVEEVRQSIDRDINGADLLYSLLSAPWLYSLLRVYECLVQHSRHASNPYLPYSSRLSQEITVSLRGLSAPSAEAQELYLLLKSPHMQALLSAHDSVAKRDYGPVLPPVPDDQPDNDEAMRIVCLVKNKQPLCVGEGKPSYWNSLRRLTMEKLALARHFGSREQSPLGSAGGLSSSTGLLSSNASNQPHSLPRYQSTGSCNLCCQTTHLSGGLNQSAPAVYNAVIMDNCVDGVETQIGDQHPTCTACAAYARSRCPPGCGFHSQTAPSSPHLQRNHSIDVTCPSCRPREFTKQHSLDELRSTVHTVASGMDTSSSRARDLQQKMVEVTEKMTDNVEENAQALSLLVEVVDKLQGLIIASKSPEVSRASRSQHVSQMMSDSFGQPIEAAKISFSNPLLVSTSFSSSSSSSASSFSSSSLICNVDIPHVELHHMSSSCQCRHRLLFSAEIAGFGFPQYEMTLFTTVELHDKQGATIRKDEKSGNMFIARVIHGGLAHRSGLLHPGDKLVEVNGQKVRGMQPERVINILMRSQGNILFKVIPSSPQPIKTQATLYVRAMVDYSPLQDPAIPCPVAGLAFSKGDLLEIVDQRDVQWWQARKLHSTSLCCGLIPSTNQFKYKQRELWWSQPYQAHTCIRPLSADDVGEEEILDDISTETDEEDFEYVSEEGENGEHMQGLYIAGFRHSLRVWRRKSYSKGKPSCYSCDINNCYNTSANLYEEVLHYQRHIDDPPRLIVLIGPSGVGVNELRRRLIKINPNTYQGPLSHTTRPQNMGEKNGREYQFVTKEVFAYMVLNHKFFEYGEHNGHMYGTSLDSVRDVLDNGKICVIDIEPHCIQSVRTKKLKPYIIYVRPPSPEYMRQTRKDPHFIANSYFKRYFHIKDFEEIEEASRAMETKCRQFFDCVIVNDDLQDSCMDLFTAIQHAQEEPQWIPVSWFAPDRA